MKGRDRILNVKFSKGANLIKMDTEIGRSVARRLEQEDILWLVTVRDDGLPQPTPVWFVWDGESFLIYSQPQKQKLRNIARNEKVSLHLNSDESGSNIVVISGRAAVDQGTPLADQVPAYIEKYRSGIKSLGMTPEGFAQDYSIPIRVTPTGLRAE
jgi:PPOX class probable F420-dependent enzyme